MLDQLKEARKAGVELPGAELLKHCAHSLRMTQLRAAGEAQQAAALEPLVAQSRPSETQLREVPEALAAIFARCGDLAVALRLARLRPEAPLGRVLVDRVVLEQACHALAVGAPADDSWALLAEPLEAAAGAMARGAWQEAEAALAGIPRHSPAAAWRVLCKAMVAAQRGDSQAMERGIALLPADFGVVGVAQRLRNLCGTGDSGDAGQAAAALAELRKHPGAQALKPLVRLVSSLGPSNAQDALEILAREVGPGRLSLNTLQAAVDLLLPMPRRRVIKAKLAFLVRANSRDDRLWPAAATYLGLLPEEFAHPEPARARLLEYLAREAADCPRSTQREVAECLGTWLDEEWGAPDLVVAGLLRASLRDDPDNVAVAREFCAVLTEVDDLGDVHGIDTLLTGLAKHFDKAAAPLLLLAELHQERGSYRRVQQLMTQALKREPQNDAVMDMCAASLLAAALASARLKRHEAALKDLQAAKAMNRPSLAEFTEVTQTVCEFYADETGVIRLLREVPQEMPIASATRHLLLVAGIVRRASPPQAASLERGAHALLDDTQNFDSAAVRALLAPLPKLVKARIPEPDLSAWWQRLLAQLSDEDLLQTYLQLLHNTLYSLPQVLADVRRRLAHGHSGALALELRLYADALSGMNGQEVDVEALQSFVDAAGPKERERLEAAAAQLAPLAPHVWGPSLRTLRFDDLTYMGRDEDFTDDDLLDDDDLLNDDDVLQAALQMYEKMLDHVQLRGKGQQDLAHFADFCSGQPTTASLLQILVTAAANMNLPLSREGRIVLNLFAQSNPSLGQRS